MAIRSADLRPNASLVSYFSRVRTATQNLCRTLEPEDYVVQSMPCVSPTKWHLAHTTWFFEQFILVPHVPHYTVHHADYHHLFNSYYQTKGQMHARPERGLLSRPTVAEINTYRRYVDDHILKLIESHPSTEIEGLITLGLHHEQQHQELMLTDIKHVFSVNPLEPALIHPGHDGPHPTVTEYQFIQQPGGIQNIGAYGTDFCFDNETPRHGLLLRDFEIANRLITNHEYRAFIEAGGYSDSTLWLSDGWDWIQREAVNRPLYWSADLDSEFTLGGRQTIQPDAPVCHVSFYEADAFARWAGARLPTEAEWEVTAKMPREGNFVDSGKLHPRVLNREPGNEPAQMFGDVWEWTASNYAPYPGFKPLAGSLGEYNGKFMCNQMVCRGGSCATPADHIRRTYRNFFYPSDRWQFFGIRLARDVQ